MIDDCNVLADKLARDVITIWGICSEWFRYDRNEQFWKHMLSAPIFWDCSEKYTLKPGDLCDIKRFPTGLYKTSIFILYKKYSDVSIWLFTSDNEYYALAIRPENRLIENVEINNYISLLQSIDDAVQL